MQLSARVKYILLQSTKGKRISHLNILPKSPLTIYRVSEFRSKGGRETERESIAPMSYRTKQRGVHEVAKEHYLYNSLKRNGIPHGP
jgi:hypothetical protein